MQKSKITNDMEEILMSMSKTRGIVATKDTIYSHNLRLYAQS